MPEGKKRRMTFCNFFEDVVEAYVSVFVNVLGFVKESAKDQECISLYIYGSVRAIPTYRVY